ncbi:MAG: hypothetical protein GEU90_00575 [Gemmatimonas sp.]|nr:hypothetical protein [Gemmatimonas sp.]
MQDQNAPPCRRRPEGYEGPPAVIAYMLYEDLRAAKKDVAHLLAQAKCGGPGAESVQRELEQEQLDQIHALLAIRRLAGDKHAGLYIPELSLM